MTLTWYKKSVKNKEQILRRCVCKVYMYIYMKEQTSRHSLSHSSPCKVCEQRWSWIHFEIIKDVSIILNKLKLTWAFAATLANIYIHLYEVFLMTFPLSLLIKLILKILANGNTTDDRHLKQWHLKVWM